MNYGAVGVGPVGAPTGQGVGAGGVSYVGMVKIVSYPARATQLTAAGVAAGLSIYGPPAVAGTLVCELAKPKALELVIS
jgi:hypothetical protein